MTNKTNQGAMIAAMAAGLLAGGAPVVAQAAASAKVQCAGVNECKGKSSCHTATNACAGQNSCKGKGWVEMNDKECAAKKASAAGAAKPAKPAK